MSQTYLALNSEEWWDLVNKVMGFRLSKIAGCILTRW
jgi:hypothetical protein